MASKFFEGLFHLQFSKGSVGRQLGLSPNAEPSEPLSRFIDESSKYRRSPPEAKGDAFEPSKRDGTTSVFRVLGLAEEEIWELAVTQVAPYRGKRTLARAEINASRVWEVGLNLECDNDPPRHAAIAGWPEQKNERINKAQELARLSRLRIRPDGTAG